MCKFSNFFSFVYTFLSFPYRLTYPLLFYTSSGYIIHYDYLSLLVSHIEGKPLKGLFYLADDLYIILWLWHYPRLKLLLQLIYLRCTDWSSQFRFLRFKSIFYKYSSSCCCQQRKDKLCHAVSLVMVNTFNKFIGFIETFISTK